MSHAVTDPGWVDEPRDAETYAEVLSRVASERRPVIVRRDGTDLAAVIPLEYLELLRDLVMRQEAEALATQVDCKQAVRAFPPPQDWFDGDEPKPF